MRGLMFRTVMQDKIKDPVQWCKFGWEVQKNEGEVLSNEEIMKMLNG